MVFYFDIEMGQKEGVWEWRFCGVCAVEMNIKYGGVVVVFLNDTMIS